MGDVDEVIIEYGATTDMEQEDKVTDAEGKEIEDVAPPVVSKAVKIRIRTSSNPVQTRRPGSRGRSSPGARKKYCRTPLFLRRAKTTGRFEAR